MQWWCFSAAPCLTGTDNWQGSILVKKGHMHWLALAVVINQFVTYSMLMFDSDEGCVECVRSHDVWSQVQGPIHICMLALKCIS